MLNLPTILNGLADQVPANETVISCHPRFMSSFNLRNTNMPCAIIIPPPTIMQHSSSPLLFAFSLFYSSGSIHFPK